MFDFLRKCTQITQPIGVRERAPKTFPRIEGLDDIKEMMLRALLVRSGDFQSFV